MKRSLIVLVFLLLTTQCTNDSTTPSSTSALSTPTPLDIPSGIAVTIEFDALSDWDGIVPVEWRMPDGGTPRYHLQITGNETVVQECRYTDMVTSAESAVLIRDRVDAVVTLTDVRTGNTVASQSFKGEQPEMCPAYKSFIGSTDRVTGRPSQAAVAEWLIATLGEEADLPPLRTQRLTGHTGLINSVQYGPDGAYLVSASDDGTARIWDVQSRAEILQLTEHDGAVRYAEFSPDGTQVLTFDDGGFIRIWDAQTGSEDFVFTSHSENMYPDVSAAHFSPDGNTIISVERYDELLVWDAATGEVQMSLPMHTVDACYSRPDGSRIAVSGKLLIEYDAITGEALTTYGEQLATDSVRCSTVWCSPVGTLIAVRCEHGLQVRTHVFDTLIGDHLGTGSLVMAFSPDGRYFARASRPEGEPSLRIVEARTGEEVGTMKIDGYHAIDFSPDGTHVAIGSSKGLVIYDISTLFE